MRTKIRRGLARILSKRLRTRIIVRSFVPTAIILLAVALVTFYAYQQVVEELAIERDQELTRLSANQLVTKLGAHEEQLTALARTSDVYQGDSASQRDALERASNRLAIFDGGVLFLDYRGIVVATEPARPQVLGQNWSDRAYYREIVNLQRAAYSPKLVLSDIIKDGPGGTDVIAYVQPVIGERDEFRGILVGMFCINSTATNAFYGEIVKLRIGTSGSFYLVDGNGRVIYHPDSERIGQDLSALPVVHQALMHQPGAIRTQDLNGRDIVAGFASVAGTSWGLVTEETWANLIGRFRGYQSFLLILLALGVLLPAIIVSIGVRQITQPLTDLTQAAQEVARGNFGQTISASTGDEIEDLARHFNLMSAQLQASYSHLEQRVSDRTRELATLHAIAEVVSRSLDLDDILGDALDETLAMLQVESGVILLTEQDGKTITPRAYRGLSEEFFVEAARRASQGQGISARLMAQNEPFTMGASEYSRYSKHLAPIMLQAGVQTLAGAPLVHKGQNLGVLILITRRARAFPPQEMELLAAIGQQIGVGVKNAWLYASVQQELDERVRAEEQLQKKTVQLEQANAELSQYAYVVSHDVRAPLRAIHNYADFLREDLKTTLDGDAKTYLDGIGHAVQEAEELATDLLELSRVGQQSVHSEKVEVGVFLRGLLARLDLPQDVEIVMGANWPSIVVNPVLMGQIFQNLITNAIKFNDSNPRRVELDWQPLKKDGQEIWGYEFLVRDNGIGIEPHYHEQIFRVFERLYTRQEYDGTGIGLAIVKKAVDKLGGSVRLESQPGKGSTFFVSLPQTYKEKQK